LFLLSEIQESNEEFIVAKKNLENIFKIYENFYGIHSYEYLNVLFLYSDILRNLKEYENSLKGFLKA
jgi:uncharacterized protein involved in tolerance to divalent cations